MMTKDKLTKALAAVEQAQLELDQLTRDAEQGRPVNLRLLRQHRSTVNHAAVYVREAARAKQRASVPVLDLMTR